MGCAARYRQSASTGWVPCSGDGYTPCNKEQADVVTKFTQKKRPQDRGVEVSFDTSNIACLSQKMHVCWKCACTVVIAHLSPRLEAANGKSRNMKQESYINDVLFVAGVHGTQRAEDSDADDARKSDAPDDDARDSGVGVASRQHPRRASEAPSGDGTLDCDPLDFLWRLARPAFVRGCFMYSVLMTSCRVALISQGRAAELNLGTSAFDGHTEGEHVLRYFVRLYPIMPSSLLDELSGLPTPPGEDWDIRYKNFIFVPSSRQLRRYIGSPYPFGEVITISSHLVREALAIFSRLGLGSKSVAVTCDKVYADSQTAAVSKNIFFLQFF